MAATPVQMLHLSLRVPFASPSWKATHGRTDAEARSQVRKGVLYGGRESYHHMCRYFSGFFQLHPLLADVDYYWRVEPDVHFYCDLAYDPFRYMHQQCVSG